MRTSRITVLVLPCLLLAACSSGAKGASAPASGLATAAAIQAPSTSAPAAPSAAGGIGSTTDTMIRIHGSAQSSTGPCALPDACFGATIANTESGATAAITDVSLVNGLVGGYQLNLPTGTSADRAVTMVLGTLPPDARASTVTTISGTTASCAYFNVSSPRLAAIFPNNAPSDPFSTNLQATVGVELTTTDGQGFSHYDPLNVQDAHLKLGADASSMAC